MCRRQIELASARVEGVLIEAAIRARDVIEVVPESAGCEDLIPETYTLDDVVAATVEVAHIVAVDEVEGAGFAAADDKVLDRS